MVLAVRVIPVILYNGERVVKGKKFDSWRSIGHVRQSVRLYNARQVDEIICLDVAATNSGKGPNIKLIRDLSTDVFSPITFGGGVSELDHFRVMLENGADKIAINTAAVDNPKLIDEAAKRFGSQAVVISIDVLDGVVYTRSGKNRTLLDPVSWARECQDRGAGEIVLNSIERDGTMAGYDLHLVQSVSTAISIPTVACGGAGQLADFTFALDIGSHGVAASAIFCFTDITPADVSAHIKSCGYPARV